MHKTRVHEIVWFPFRPEQKFVGPLLILLLLIVGATGIIKSVDVYTSFVSNNVVGSGPWILILVLALCLVACINAARSDYISILAALLPCAVTILLIVAISLFITSPKIDTKSALVQAAVGAFVSLGLIGRIVQSGGTDLGKLGTLCRRTKEQITRVSRTAPTDDSFAVQRAELVKDVRQLAAAIQEAAAEVVSRASSQRVADRLQEFIDRSKLVDHADFQRDVLEGPTALKTTLEMIGERE